MELTRDILNSSEEIIRSVINGKLTEPEINKIKRLIEKSSNEEELNNKLERYKKQIEQILLMASNTLKMQLNEEQERKIRAIVAKPTNKERFVDEFYYVIDELKEQNKEKMARRDYWFKFVEGKLLTRKLTEEEKGHIIQVLETTPRDAAAKVKLKLYAEKLVDKDTRESLSKIKVPIKNNRDYTNSEYIEWRIARQGQRYRNVGKNKARNKKRSNHNRKFIAGLLATGALATTIGISNYIGDKNAEKVHENFSEEKIEQIMNNEERQDTILPLLEVQYEYYMDDTDRLTPESVKKLGEDYKKELELLLETELNKASENVDYEHISYGYNEQREDFQYYIKMGDKMYGSNGIELIVGHYMSGDITKCVKVLEQLDFPEVIDEKDVKKYAKIIKKAKKEIDDLKEKDVRMGKNIKTVKEKELDANTEKTQVTHEEDEER